MYAYTYTYEHIHITIYVVYITIYVCNTDSACEILNENLFPMIMNHVTSTY